MTTKQGNNNYRYNRNDENKLINNRQVLNIWICRMKRLQYTPTRIKFGNITRKLYWVG